MFALSLTTCDRKKATSISPEPVKTKTAPVQQSSPEPVSRQLKTDAKSFVGAYRISFTENEWEGGDLSELSMMFRVKTDETVIGSFKGRTGDKPFSIDLRGWVNPRGKFAANGSRGPHGARTVGELTSGTGTIRGSIENKTFTAKFVTERVR